MKVTASAPGKLMLFGEHAVIYGHNCMATAVDQRLFVTVEHAGKNSIEAPQVKDTRFIQGTLEYFRERFQISTSFSIKTRSEFMQTYGLGSSSAVTVATLHALSVLSNITLTQQQLFEHGYKIIHTIQGKGSGFDTAVTAYGGTIIYGQGGQTLQSIDIGSLPLIVCYTGNKADTVAFINRVENIYNGNKSKVTRMFRKIASLVSKAKDSIYNSDLHTLGGVMNDNQAILRALSVSTPMIDKLISSALSAGAYGAKISGAGGGDCILVLSPPNLLTHIRHILTEMGGEIVDTTINAEGSRIEK